MSLSENCISNNSVSIIVYLFGLTLLLIQLSACGTMPTQTDATTSTMPDDIALDQQNPNALLREYQERAKLTTLPNERAYYQLLAMELLMDFGKISDVAAQLPQLNRRALDQSYQYRLDLIDAQLTLAKGDADRALRILPTVHVDYPPAIQARLLRTRAMALARLGQMTESLDTRLQLDEILVRLLPDSLSALERNHQVIWSLLQGMPDDKLLNLRNRHRNWRGWQALAYGVRNARRNGVSQDAVINDWLRRYSQHPAVMTLASSLRSQQDFITEYPTKLALLLPLQGRYADAAHAIRDGFLSAYFRHRGGAAPSLRIYDTSGDLELVQAQYAQALQEGATMIIGPLRKSAVTQLLSTQTLTVPVLALNYSPDLQADNVVQFGLLPEDEARQIAEFISQRGQSRSLVFVPNNAYGERLSRAFAERYTELGGEVLTIEKYSPETNHHSPPIQRALNILQSQNRNSILRAVLKTELKFEPHRRQDVDAIVLIADPLQARNFQAQLKFHDADDIPVYANSNAFMGIVNPKLDRDLDGLTFCDMPWTLSGARDPYFSRIQQLWPNDLRKQPRLYALGIDAYQIIPYLNYLPQNPHYHFAGLTGKITLDHQRRAHRKLVWAQFQQGRPQQLVEPTEDSAEIDGSKAVLSSDSMDNGASQVLGLP